MSFTEAQASALEALTSQLPDDLVSGVQVPDLSKPAGDSPWLRDMLDVAKNLENRAAAFYNVQVRDDRPDTSNRTPQRILSSEGFPADIVVRYATPPMLAYLPKTEPREIKHIVFHSYGHTWHARPLPGAQNWGGWLNRTGSGEGAEAFDFDGNTVYIAKGSDSVTLSHPERIRAAVRAALGPASRATPHFFIDRNGDLLVIGNVNDVMFMSDSVNETSISISLEEAFYLTKDPNEEKAIWSPEGNPPGTAGNVEYFSFAIPQLLTLSILCKKLEVAFPNLASRTIDFTRRSLTGDSPDGYTMHDFVSGAKHVDISPHFLTQALWDNFFKLVDSHTDINSTNIWRPIGKYKEVGTALASSPLSDNPVNLPTERVLENSRGYGLGLARALRKATFDKSEIFKDAGDKTLADSKKVTQTAANTYNLVQQTENLPVTLMEEDLSEDDQGGWDDTW